MTTTTLDARLVCPTLETLDKQTFQQVLELLTLPDYLQLTSASQSLAKHRQRDDLLFNANFAKGEVLRRVLRYEENVNMQGPAGCGKTYTLKLLHRLATEANIPIAMTATTGVAATHLPEGMTIHMLSRLGKIDVPIKKMQKWPKIRSVGWRRKHWAEIRRLRILVLDEISMLGAQSLERLDWLFRTVRENKLPFGGVTLVLCGDFAQLPPVNAEPTFQAPIWRQLGLHVVQFKVCYRQGQDRHFFDLLQRVRHNRVTRQDCQKLISRVAPQDVKTVASQVAVGNSQNLRFVSPWLMSRKHQVAQINEAFMGCIQDDHPRLCVATDVVYQVSQTREGKAKFEMLEECAPYPKPIARLDHRMAARLTLLDGAQYFLTVNLNPAKGWVNGARAIYQADLGTLVFENGTRLPLDLARTNIKIKIGIDRVLERWQFPLRPGYAATFHASQGMSLQEAVMDLGRSVFTGGQSYVGLSRLTSLAGLKLTAFHASSLRMHDGLQQYEAVSGMRETLPQVPRRAKLVQPATFSLTGNLSPAQAASQRRAKRPRAESAAQVLTSKFRLV